MHHAALARLGTIYAEPMQLAWPHRHS